MTIHDQIAAETSRLHTLQRNQMPRCGQSWKPTYGHMGRVYCAFPARRMFVLITNRADGSMAASLHTDGGLNSASMGMTSAVGEAENAFARRFVKWVRNQFNLLD